MPVRVVHLVAKTHLDLGFTALASEVEAQYLGELFPRAIGTARALAASGGEATLVWTTGSWILHRALADPDAGRAAEVEAAIGAGHLAWHALPLTFHTELMDPAMVRSALGVAAELDARFGRTTTAAKMTDVPGHTRGLVPLLAAAGVTFLHLGVNPAWPVPDVPAAFRWRAPDGTEVVVAYQAGGYGGEVVVDGCDHALAFLHSGDNLGPPSAAEVVAAHRELADRHPGAQVRGSTLDAFARALQASGAVAELPVVTAEIGDPWLFGSGSDPQKLASFRRLLQAREALDPVAATAVDRVAMLVAEHTWGLDQKEVLPTEPHWDGVALAELRQSAAGRRFEASWAEQRAYLDEARRLGGSAVDEAPRPALADPTWAPEGHTPLVAGERIAGAGWEVVVDPATGAVRHLCHVASGRVLADAHHPLGLVTHQTFSADDYERFYAQLTPTPDDEWWARRDNTKPGIDAAGAQPGRAPGELTAAWARHEDGGLDDGGLDDGGLELVVEVRFASGEPAGAGAPPLVRLRWRFRGDHTIGLELAWPAKPATRLPEAIWLSFVPMVAEPSRWVFDKLGHDVSPLDVVRRGGRSLHAVGHRGVRYDGPDGALVVRTLDAPLVAPGAPNLLDADPPPPDLAGGVHVLLHDNCWGTNFPMWSDGPAWFSFELAVG